MGKNSIYAGIPVMFTTVVASGFAQAAEVDFTGANTDMGTVVAGQFGTLNDNYIVTPLGGHPPINFDSSNAFGILPNDTEIIFSYHLPSLLHSDAELSSSYSYLQGLNTVTGEADATSVNPFQTSSTTLAFASAFIESSKGKTIIENVSGDMLDFTSFFSGLLHQGNVNLTYVVDSISGVGVTGGGGGPVPLDPTPLPAALPMFGVILAGLFGLGRRRVKVI